jgi:hypothetical protein
VRRLPRILLNALTTLELILFAATVALWVRSYWCEDNVTRAPPAEPAAQRSFQGLWSGGGGVAVYAGTRSPPIPADVEPEGWDWKSFDARRPVPYAGGVPVNGWGFGQESHGIPGVRVRSVVFPLWLPTILFVALPLTMLAFFVRRRRRTKPWRCVKCGHALRATPERCPECGTAVGAGNALADASPTEGAVGAAAKRPRPGWKFFQ